MHLMTPLERTKNPASVAGAGFWCYCALLTSVAHAAPALAACRQQQSYEQQRDQASLRFVACASGAPAVHEVLHERVKLRAERNRYQHNDQALVNACAIRDAAHGLVKLA
jgi:hypothetical protein